MGNPIPCFISDSDEARLWDAADTAEAMRATEIEQHTDYLLEECKKVDYCGRLIIEFEMLDGCAAIMAEIANWSGRSDESNDRMKRLHVLLANTLRDVAERREVEA